MCGQRPYVAERTARRAGRCIAERTDRPVRLAFANRTGWRRQPHRLEALARHQAMRATRSIAPHGATKRCAAQRTLPSPVQRTAAPARSSGERLFIMQAARQCKQAVCTAHMPILAYTGISGNYFGNMAGLTSLYFWKFQWECDGPWRVP